MLPGLSLEPNPAPGRMITARFLDQLVSYLESRSAGSSAHAFGLLPAIDGSSRAVFLDPPEVLQCPFIRAVGERGQLLWANPSVPESAIQPLDTTTLPVGSHRIYVCLTAEKVPCGRLVQEKGRSDRDPELVQYREHRLSRLVLAADEDRLRHRDWLQVSALERIREGGSTRTHLVPGFHPAVTSMRAYAEDNPLELLARRALALIPPEDDDPGSRIARNEAVILYNIANEAAPDVAFAQAQRCLLALRSVADAAALVDGRLLSERFSVSDFPSFLRALHAHVSNLSAAVLFPTVLEIDGVPYQRAEGELIEGDDFWSWSHPCKTFTANGVALYFPSSEPGSVPLIRWGRHRTNSNSLGTAVTAERLSARGTAVKFDKFNETDGPLYLTPEAHTKHIRLRKHLEDGHALYYW